MAGKGKKKRNSKDSTESGGNGKKKSKKKSSSKGKSAKFHGDILNEAAMENAYYVCHNVQVNVQKEIFEDTNKRLQFYSRTF